MTWVNGPVCDECWEKENPDLEPARMRESYRQVEVCCRCGDETRSGIYVRTEVTP